MPPKTLSRWKKTQIAEKLHGVAQELRSLAYGLADYRFSTNEAAASRQREVSSYLDDVSSLLAGQMPDWDAARQKASDLTACAEILKAWAANPTDRTGLLSRVAQLRGVADSIDAFICRLA